MENIRKAVHQEGAGLGGAIAADLLDGELADERQQVRFHVVHGEAGELRQAAVTHRDGTRFIRAPPGLTGLPQCAVDSLFAERVSVLGADGAADVVFAGYI